MRRILRRVIPVDDQWHRIDANNKTAAECASRISGEVDLWLDHDTSEPLKPYWFRVYGTGHQLPIGPRWVGTALDGPLVWHVLVASRNPDPTIDAADAAAKAEAYRLAKAVRTEQATPTEGDNT